MRDSFWSTRRRIAALGAATMACLGPIACTSPISPVASGRSFDFERDIFAYTNNNYWIYDLDSDPDGPVTKERLEKIDHGQRCTIMSRTARQFYYGARFDPDAQKVSADAYRRLIRRVIATNPRREEASQSPVLFPGYADLRSLSIDYEAMLKEELAGRWIGYFQRGNWRMVFAFSPDQNRATARELVQDLSRGHLPLVHVLNYPRVDINHTVLLFAYEESPLQILFELYDPNDAKDSGSIVFDRASATFSYNRTDYFVGGPAQVYEIYDGILF